MTSGAAFPGVLYLSMPEIHTPGEPLPGSNWDAIFLYLENGVEPAYEDWLAWHYSTFIKAGGQSGEPPTGIGGEGGDPARADPTREGGAG